MQIRSIRKPSRNRHKPKAATTDILGPPLKPERIPLKFKKYYGRLVDLRDSLLNQKNELVRDGKEELPGYSTHMADAGTDEYDRDFALSMLSSEQDALYEIEQALERIRDGTYGICELTGKPIERARLEAIPWTRFTAEVEKQFEREGAVKKARLAPPHRVPKADPNSEADEDE